MTGSEHFGKDAGDYHGGDGHSGEATHDHGREHLAHQEFLLLRGLRQSGAGSLGDDGIGRETVECGHFIRKRRIFSKEELDVMKKQSTKQVIS